MPNFLGFCPNSKRLYSRIWSFVRPFRWRLVTLLLLNLLATPIALLLPVPLQIVVDSVIGDRPLPVFLSTLVPQVDQSRSGFLVLAVLLLFSLTVLRLLVDIRKWMLGESIGQTLVLHFRAQLFQKAQQLSLLYHERRGTGDTQYRIQHDAPSIQWLVIWQLIPFASALLMLTAMIVVIFSINSVLAAVALLVCPVFVILSWSYSKRLRQQWETAKGLENKAFAIPSEILSALRVTKAFGQEVREQARFEQKLHDSLTSRLAVVRSETTFVFLLGLTIGVGTAVVLYLGGYEVQLGSMTIGKLIVVMAYLGSLYDPLQTIGRQVAEFQGPLVGLRRCFELLEQPTDVLERKEAITVDRVRGNVRFENVSFSYIAGSPVLRNVSFEVPPGSSLGIAGPTGSGKSTLMALLIRFYDPDAGRVLLDGIDLREYRVTDARRQVSIVLQEPVLFSGTLRENVAYGRPDATEKQILAAVEAANARDFIDRLPQKLGTTVGERGITLSGGERQRIALARAFLKDAPILILDEPTSSVDKATEELILDALRALLRNRTTFMIAHHGSMLKLCDMRLDLDSGRVSLMTKQHDQDRSCAEPVDI